MRPQLDNAKQEVSDKYLLLEEAEKQALRRALVEERSRFCCVAAMLRPVVVSHKPDTPRKTSARPHLTCVCVCVCVRRRRCPCLARSATFRR